jgi:hypothetical protein
MFEGIVGSYNVVSNQDGVCVGGGARLHELARVILDDGPNVGSLSSGVVGTCGCSTLGDGCQ